MDIYVKDVSHTFSQAGLQSDVLKELNCQFSANDITALVGPSGSGKSTFLSLIGSLDRPTGGQITYNGQDITKWKNRQLSKFRAQEIGFVFQQFQLLLDLHQEEECGILFVTHDLALAERADRILFMQDGRIIEDRRKQTIRSV